jgi:hypothetical protein
MGLLMARRAEDNQILCSVISQSAPRLNVMDLKILHSPAPLTTPSKQVPTTVSVRTRPAGLYRVNFPIDLGTDEAE